MSHPLPQVSEAHPTSASIVTQPPRTPQEFSPERAQLILGSSPTGQSRTPHRVHQPETPSPQVQKVGHSALGLNPSNSNFEALSTLIAEGLLSEHYVIRDMSGELDLVATDISIKQQENLIELFNSELASICEELGKRVLDKAPAVIALLTYGADPNRKVGNYTLLHLAAIEGNKDIAKLLLDKGAKVDVQDVCSTTPLHLAAIEGNKDIAKLLLDKGAEVDVQDVLSNTALHLAAREGYKDIVELLLVKRADIHARDFKGKTPLHWAVIQGERDIAALLLGQGANFEAQDSDGNTPLHSAVLMDKKDSADLLLTRGADVNAQNKQGKTPLDVAEMRGNKDITGMLRAALIKKRVLNIESEAFKSKTTPLHIAVNEQDVEVIAALLERGEDINAKDDFDNTPLHVAVGTGNENIVKLLIKSGADIEKYNLLRLTPLLEAVSSGNLRMVSLLLENGADTKGPDWHGFTPIKLLPEQTSAADREAVTHLLSNQNSAS
ncbi:MAG: ankyrin repeat domain-containing protein [Chlamydiales bacterium]|nr:ankyrin repeat domain-containing protein [Chlamydiales bacterium]